MSGTTRRTAVTFGHLMPYAARISAGVRTGVGSRAYAWLEVRNPATGAISRREFGLIDSGCDDCLLNAGLLTPALGLHASPAGSVVVAGGGTIPVSVVHGAEIDIEGITVTGRPLTFASAASAAPSLIGRDIFLRAFELALRGGDWLHA